jgi:MscS family membrane protein
MIEQLKDFLLMNEETRWVTQVFVVIFLTLFVGYFVGKFVDKLIKKFEKTKNLWDDALIYALRRPIRILIWIIGMTFAVEIIYKETQTPIFSAIYPFRDVGIIACMSWFVTRFIKNAQDNIIDRGKKKDGSGYDKTTVDAISKILRASVMITAALVILQTLGFSISGVLAFGGVGGVAIGFAAKDLLANFFGAMMIYLDKPFKIGDWIRSPDQEIEGTVEEIGWRQTRIRTFDKRPLYVPNSVFSSIAVENPSRMLNRRIKLYVGVRYDDMGVVKKIVDEVKQMLIDHEEIDKNMTMIVNVDEFAASSVNFLVYTFTHTKDWVEYHQIKQDVMLKISDIIENNGAEIAFPTSTLHIPDGIAVNS